MASEDYEKRRRRLWYDNLREQSKEESKFVDVPVSLKGLVIGKGGRILHEIMEKTGTRIVSQSKEEAGFTVFGDEEQTAHAERLIKGIVDSAKRRRRELIKVEDKFKGSVKGKEAAKLRHISAQSGAKVVFDREDQEIYIIYGTEEEREYAKVLIGEKVAAAREGEVVHEKTKSTCYIDDYNLKVPRLKLEQVLKNGHPTGPPVQYRLKPAEQCELQEPSSSNGHPSYKEQLMKDVLVSLRKVKQEMAGETIPKADMWCHFGTITIQIPDREDVEGGQWSIREATERIKYLDNKHYWRLAFNLQGVTPNERALKMQYKERLSEEINGYVSRYDLTFLTPCWQRLRCKIWVANKNSKQRLEDIPIPFEVKNILGEIHFKDEDTRSRCRGWLVLKNRKYLKADILFPGCEFDCSFHIRGRRDSTQHINYAPDENVQDALLTYLSELTFTDEEPMGMHLPKGGEFHVISWRHCKRTEYTASTDFYIILSEERAWNIGNKDVRETTDVHVRYKEWDTLLSSGLWEPEAITEKLPEFLEFLKEAQAFLFHDKIPPEILARGSSAVEAYKKALTDGKTSDRRFPLMLIGQHRAGKTSLMKSLKGICYNPQEDSTVGIQVDPSYFKLTTETWVTGKSSEDQTSEITANSYGLLAARYIVDNVKPTELVTESADVFHVAEESFEPDGNEISYESTPNDPAENADIIQEPNPSIRSHEFGVLPSSTNLNARPVTHESIKIMPEFEEVATVTESLLRGDLEDNRDDVCSNFWDFAGQSVYYDTHPLFLTSRAIYCLVYDLSLDPYGKAGPLEKQGVYKTIPESANLKTNIDYLNFWMTSVASLTCSEEECCSSDVLPKKLPAVFLVCTHADKPFGGRDPRELSVEIFGYLKDKPYGDHLCDVFFVDNTSLRVKSSDCLEVARLRQEVLEKAKELPHIKATIPIKWLRFEKALQAVKKKGYKCISLEAAKDIASKVCKVNEDNEFTTLMNYLHDLRSLIHFDHTDGLKKIIVLNPQWLIDVFKKVITVKPYDADEKKFLDSWLKLEREGVLDEDLLAHVWGPLFNEKETCATLIEIMEKFCLLCSWPCDTTSNKSYLVPSMLKSPPPTQLTALAASAKFPSLFIKFESGLVPAGFFPRLVLQVFQWGKDKLWRDDNPHLFNRFARFFTTEDGYSVILICNSSTVEIVIYKESHNLELAEDASLMLSPSLHCHQDTTGINCCSVVRKQLGLTLECMRKEFFWLKNMKYEMSVLCPVCCKRGSVAYCRTHQKEDCEEEQCLHFLSLTELYCSKQVFCTRSAFTKNPRVPVEQFAPWFPFKEQLGSGLPSSDGSTKEGGVQSIPENCSRELNITLLASEWSSSMGGLSTLNRKLAVFLAKQPQVNVTLLVPQNTCSEEDKKNASQSKVTIQEAKMRTGYDPLDWLWSPPSSLSIDVIVGHGAKLGKQAQFITESHWCKWVQMVHTAPEELGMYKDYPGAVAIGEMKNRVEVDLCKLADLVVAVGAKLRDAYSSYLRSCQKSQDIIQLTPGTFDEFKTVKQAAQDGEKFKVLTFGRGDPEDFELKGYDIAPKALVELEDNSYCLVFVGAPEGKEDEVKERLLESRIPKNQLTVRKFIQSKERLKELFCEVDLAIMPSRTEGFGLTGLEALSDGPPILVSGNSGFGIALRGLPQGHSFVMDSEDPKDWAKEIASVRQKERAKRLKEIQSLRTNYEERYNWEKQCTSLIEKLWSLTKET